MKRLSLLVYLPALLMLGCGEKQNPDELRASGTIEATEVRLAGKTPGIVRVLRLDEGSRVQAGDTVVVIDSDLMVLQLRQSEEGVAVAEAQLALLRRGARPEDVAQARAALRQAEAQARQAEQDAERFSTLAASGSGTEKQKDDALARLAVAVAAREAAQQNVVKMQNLARPEEIRAAEARVRQAKAQSDVLRRQIVDAYVVTPISGIVTEKAIEEGELAASGATLLTLANLDRVDLRIFVPETHLGRIKVGQTVDVYTDSAPNRAAKGRISFISPEAEFTPKNVQTREERVKLVYEVKVDLPNPDGMLKPGMYADAVLHLDPSVAR